MTSRTCMNPPMEVDETNSKIHKAIKTIAIISNMTISPVIIWQRSADDKIKCSNQPKSVR